ncbi:MAG TPA: porin [Pelomicrobium sp.]|nr:porin [Pelomicrobium sp.]
MKPVLKPLCAALGAAGILAGASGGAWASGFQLLEQNASQLGNAYSGTAAAAEDASTIYFNPAGMAYLKGRDFAFSLNAIKPSSKFSDRGSSYATPAGPLPVGVTPPGLPPLAGNGGDAGDWALLPAIYYAHAIDTKWSLGIGINAPFGLKTEYDTPWVGQFQGIKSELKTLAITPTVSYKASPDFAIGFGLRAQKADAELTNQGFTGSVTKLEGDDWGYGFSLGVLWQATPATRVGAAYQSRISYDIQGDVQGSDILAATGGATSILGATADLTLPDILTFSVAHELNPKWDLLADIAWTNWSEFEELRVIGPTGATLTVTPQNWDDTWRFAVGANYKYSSALKFRFGVAYDETPTSDAFRTVRIPDESRWWLAIGVQYKMSPNSAIDVGYTHIFVDDPKIDKTELTPAGIGTRVVGEYDASVDVIGVQFSHSF